MTFYFPGTGPESWRALLADPAKHWKTGRSARSLAHCWEAASGFPSEVADVLDGSIYEPLVNLEFVAGFPEHQVPLPGGRRPSQTDVFVLARGSRGLVAIAVEGKVDEPFGPTVDEWLGAEPSEGKLQRLAYLIDLLGLDRSTSLRLRYQLLHRTASAVIEATRFDASTALMLVHTWARSDEGYTDYRDFAAAIGGEPAIDAVTATNVPALHVGWVRGDPRWLQA